MTSQAQVDVVLAAFERVLRTQRVERWVSVFTFVMCVLMAFGLIIYSIIADTNLLNALTGIISSAINGGVAKFMTDRINSANATLKLIFENSR